MNQFQSHGYNLPWSVPSTGFAVFLPLIVMVVLVLPPVARILGRTGHSRWWCLLAFVPLVNLIALWIFAYARWPAMDNVTDNNLK